MNEITYTRLRKNLAYVLNQVRNGEEFIVTQHRKSSVKLSSNTGEMASPDVNDKMTAPGTIYSISHRRYLKPIKIENQLERCF